MPVVVLFILFVVLLVIAVPVSITLGITSVLPSVFDPSFTVGAKYLIRAMFGGLDSFPLLAVPMFVLSGIIMAKGGISKKLDWPRIQRVFRLGFFSATLTLIGDLLPGFRFVEEHSLTEGMAVFAPVYKLLDKLPAVRNISNKIIVLEHV